MYQSHSNEISASSQNTQVAWTNFQTFRMNLMNDVFLLFRNLCLLNKSTKVNTVSVEQNDNWGKLYTEQSQSVCLRTLFSHIQESWTKIRSGLSTLMKTWPLNLVCSNWSMNCVCTRTTSQDDLIVVEFNPWAGKLEDSNFWCFNQFEVISFLRETWCP